MTTFMNVLLDVLIYDATSPSNDPADAIKMFNRRDGTKVTEVTRHKMSVPTGGAFVSVPIVGATADYVICATDQPVRVTLNGGAEQLDLVPTLPGVKTLVMFFKGTVTELEVANQGSVAANYDVILVKI